MQIVGTCEVAIPTEAMEEKMKSMTLTVLCCLAIGRYAQAMDKPPNSPRNQRSWLRDGLLSDMTGTDKWMPGAFADLDRVYARQGHRSSCESGLQDQRRRC